MNENAWKTGLEQQLPVLEHFFEKQWAGHYDISLADAGQVNNQQATADLKALPLIVRAEEQTLGLDGYLAFDHSWMELLTNRILDGKINAESKLAGDLMRDMVRQLLEVVERSLDAVGMTIRIEDVAVCSPEQLGTALTSEQYMTGTFLFHSDAEEAGRETVFSSELTVAMATPSEQELTTLTETFGDENPILDGRYAKVGTGKIDESDLEPPHAIYQQAIKNNIRTQGKTVEFEDFDKTSSDRNRREVRNINILKNVEMNLSVELGRREMPLGKILQLVKGSVIELEKLAGEPVEILVNGHTIAQGDVVVIDEHFGVRISNLLTSEEHLKELG